jgi:hypothetical protein
MTFERAFRFPGVDRRFEATMRYDAGNGAVLDVLGRQRHLLVELVPTVEGAAVTLRSRRQWLCPFGLPLRLPLPRILTGEATIREWQQDESSLGIRVTISNPLFGCFFGYEGGFRRVDDPTPGIGSAVGASAVRGSQVARCLFVCIGTLAYAASFAVATTSGTARAAGVRVATAAALSWPLFGFVLLVSQRRADLSRGLREWAGAWGDVCLRTMTRGVVPLGAAAALNLSLAAARIGGARVDRPPFIATHVGLLAASDLAMATYFIREAARLGMRSPVAVALWLGVLNGAFALWLILL